MAGRLRIGERNGTLTLLEIGEHTDKKHGHKRVRIKCDCGVTFDLVSIAFRQRVSCAACSSVRGAKLRSTHGDSARVGTGDSRWLYSAFKAMHTRCYNPNTDVWRYYGAKGITVCPEWHDYIAFKAWALANGWQKGMTLDRRKSDQPYCPSNCEYVSKSVNSIRARADYRFVKKADPFADHFPIEALFGFA